MEGATECEECPPCPDKMYRTNCKVENGQFITGTCNNCPECDEDEVNVGCMNHAGHNDANGTCMPRKWLTRAPVCPRLTEYVIKDETGKLTEKKGNLEQVGMGGYTFLQALGFEAKNAAFQCRRICSGSDRADQGDMLAPFNTSIPGERDEGTCAGPFACDFAACTMRSAYDDLREDVTRDWRTPMACPVVLETGDLNDDSIMSLKVRKTECQTCSSCGNPDYANNMPGYGRGCAAECTRLVCTEAGSIYDWTDGFPLYDQNTADRPIYARCKSCLELRDSRLCGKYSAAEQSQMLVSGNRVLHRFDGCTGRDEAVGDQHITYGECEKCLLSNFSCAEGEYPARCAEGPGGVPTQSCDQCLPRGPTDRVVVGKGTFYDENGAQTDLFCQVSCVSGWTGVQNKAKHLPAVCYKQCEAAGVCSQDTVALPCAVPHEQRCVPRYPAAGGGSDERSVKGTMPMYVNMLESVPATTTDPDSGFTTSLYFANFENLFIALGESGDNLHQCVWNAVDVRDNDKTPGGVSYTFWEPGESYALPLTSAGSKWCQWSLRNSASGAAVDRMDDVSYPLLPLQNMVGGGQPRRLLLNTSARVMRYCEGLTGGVCDGGYTGRGLPGRENVIQDHQPLTRPTMHGQQHVYVGDLYLGLEMYAARNASMVLTLPERVRNASKTAWVPRFRLSFYARDTSYGESRFHAQVALWLDAVEVGGTSTSTGIPVPAQMLSMWETFHIEEVVWKSELHLTRDVKYLQVCTDYDNYTSRSGYTCWEWEHEIQHLDPTNHSHRFGNLYNLQPQIYENGILQTPVENPNLHTYMDYDAPITGPYTNVLPRHACCYKRYYKLDIGTISGGRINAPRNHRVWSSDRPVGVCLQTDTIVYYTNISRTDIPKVPHDVLSGTQNTQNPMVDVFPAMLFGNIDLDVSGRDPGHHVWRSL